MDLTVSETAESLCCSSQYVYTLCATGQLASYRVGRSVKIRAGEVKKFKNQHAIHPPVRRAYRP